MTTQSVKKRTLETLVGPLAQTFQQFERSTIQHSDQLTTERRTNPELRNQWFYTADSALYTAEMKKGKGLLGKIKSFFVRDEESFLYLGREPTNPLFNNIGEATQQLIRTGHYVLPKEKRGEIDAVIAAGDTLKVKLSDLRLQEDNNVFCYFEIDTANYDKLNAEQRRVAERVYGSGEDFVKNMEMLNEAGIIKTGVYVLNPNYVKKNVPRGGALARASRLGHFDNGSRFLANDGSVYLRLGLRGVRNVVAEGDAPKIEVDPIAQAYDTLLGNQKRALEIMTPGRVAGLSGLVTTYLNQQKQ